MTPVTLDQAEYARVWIQDATTMSTYQAASTTVPHTVSALVIAEADAGNAAPTAALAV